MSEQDQAAQPPRISLRVGQVYAEVNRPERRPDRKLRVVLVGVDEVVLEVVGPLDLNYNVHDGEGNLWGIGVGMKIRRARQKADRFLGEYDYPLLETPLT